MAKGKAHPPEVKAAVMAALLAGQGVTEVAREYNLDPSTVKNWKGRVSPVKPEKEGVDFGVLVGNYLEEALVTAAEHQRMARGSEWFGRQNAADIGAWGGIHIDKVVRLLEAAQCAGAEDDPGCLPAGDRQ